MLSFTGKKWITPKNNQQLVEQLKNQLGLSSFLASILEQRGISNSEEGTTFLSPKLSNLTPPFDIPDLEKGIKRILEARKNKEKVLVYGDYDVDGTTSVACIIIALRELGIAAEYYIPHRYHEGYGLNIEAIEKAHKDNINLIITVDCGVSNNKEIAKANELGIDVVVTDHHLPPPNLPPALAIINPKRIAEDHPAKNLAGVGVAFKVAWGLLREAGHKDDTIIKDMLDLVALGTIADIVPMTKENRSLVKFGLQKINERKRIGIRALSDISGLNGKISTRDVAFSLAPRINAAGRLEHAALSVDLFISNDYNKALELAGELNRVNQNRQKIGSKISEESIEMIVNQNLKDNKILIMEGEEWHPGVIGIVASKMTEQFGLPAILIGMGEKSSRGSARSIGSFSVYKLLDQNRDLFVNFGGHKDAAGFEIINSNIAALKESIYNYVEKNIALEHLIPRVFIDQIIHPAELHLDIIQEMARIEPFGHHNPTPVFSCQGVRLQQCIPVGNKEHLRMKFTDDKFSFDTIAFNWKNLQENFKVNNYYDIVFELSEREWMNQVSLQIKLLDARASTNQLE